MVDPAPVSGYLPTICTLNSQGATRAIDAAEAEALLIGCHVVIAVTDSYGFLLSSRRMDGAPLVSIGLAHAKARTAALLRVPTLELQNAVDAGKTSYLAAVEITPLEGGVPVLYGDTVAGAVGVSGAESIQDAKIAAAGVAALRLR